jgi:nuclear pore complex protein Nup133
VSYDAELPRRSRANSSSRPLADQLRVLLEQDDAYRPLLTSFLDSPDNPRSSSHAPPSLPRTQADFLLGADISWINDIAIGRFGNATDALVGEAVKEQNLAQKKVCLEPAQTASGCALTLPFPQLMLSLGKLSQVAQSSKDTLFTEGVQRAIEGAFPCPRLACDLA